MRRPRLAWPGIAAIRRWHFYAGLFCIPFVLLLSLTGLVYLFRPQIDDLIDRPYERLAIAAHPLPPSGAVRVALDRLPGSHLVAYELPRTPRSAERVIVLQHGRAIRVYVDPGSGAVLKIVPEAWRFERIVFNLHGQLLLGNVGSVVVELVASWAIVMILTGLCLWWPSSTDRRYGAGLLYPRLRAGRRILWRDLHAVSGSWASLLVLFLLISGLPWAYGWGSYLKEIRSIGVSAPASADWQVGHVPARQEIAGPSPMADMPGMAPMPAVSGMAGLAAIDAVVAAVRPLRLAYPVLVTPPAPGAAAWGARSDAQDRVLRRRVAVSTDGRVLAQSGFGDQPLIDRVVAVGIAAHEGRLFGWANVVLDAFAALSMMMLGISALALWLGRRRPGRLGAPSRPLPWIAPVGFVFVLLAMGLLLPMFGLSALVVLLLERLMLRRLPGVARWLGLDRPAAVGAC